MNPIKRLAHLFFRGYSVYRIYRYTCSGESAPYADGASPLGRFTFREVEEAEILSSADQLIVQQAWYHGEGVYAYACLEEQKIVGLCFFWHGARYATRNFWPLAAGEVKLVQVVVTPEMRGRGIGRRLIEFATHAIARQGFRYAYARIWWTNTQSLNAFEKAGWVHLATVIELPLPGWKKPFRINWMKKAS